MSEVVVISQSWNSLNTTVSGLSPRIIIGVMLVTLVTSEVIVEVVLLLYTLLCTWEWNPPGSFHQAGKGKIGVWHRAVNHLSRYLDDVVIVDTEPSCLTIIEDQERVCIVSAVLTLVL
jgi:hypothetical protein